jgi:hypothetical protein
VEIRCDNGILFGVVEDGVLEVKCRSRRCGHEAGTVVIHRFDLLTGEQKGTLQFKDPANQKGVSEDGDRRHFSSLRSA